MKICIFGKFPPIQGGVSMRTYWAAHGLAQLGHTVHVITNAKEAGPPYRMFMRTQDWSRCEAHYGPGSVQVHWTESYGDREWHIPASMPFVTKLASLGLELTQKEPIDLIYAHYAEPYCVASHIVAQATGLPHVVRTAGSDAGRLWRLPQFGALYRHIFTTADRVICGPSVARKMTEAGVAADRISLKPDTHVSLAQLFTPDGEALDVADLRHQVAQEAAGQFPVFGEFDASLIYLGVYGKLGRNKGTQSLLAALKAMHERGLPVGLLVMAHERPGAGDAFRAYVKANGLERRVCQLPFLPHWRVPEFIRRCVAVCCLEQDFPIKFHDPVVAREVLTCGGCLVGSAEVIGKLPQPRRLIDGYNCVAVDDVNRSDDLAQRLTWVIESPDQVREMRGRARQYGLEIEAGNGSALWLESALAAAAGRDRSPPLSRGQAFRDHALA